MLRIVTSEIRKLNEVVKLVNMVNPHEAYLFTDEEKVCFGAIDPSHVVLSYFYLNDTNYYDFVFDTKDHQDLKQCCDDITKNNNKFLITYDDCQEVIDLYKEYFVYRTDPIIYSSSDERGKRELSKTELFITNYDLHKMFQNKVKKDMFGSLELKDKVIEIRGGYNLERI